MINGTRWLSIAQFPFSALAWQGEKANAAHGLAHVWQLGKHAFMEGVGFGLLDGDPALNHNTLDLLSSVAERAEQGESRSGEHTLPLLRLRDWKAIDGMTRITPNLSTMTFDGRSPSVRISEPGMSAETQFSTSSTLRAVVRSELRGTSFTREVTRDRTTAKGKSKTQSAIEAQKLKEPPRQGCGPEYTSIIVAGPSTESTDPTAGQTNAEITICCDPQNGNRLTFWEAQENGM